MFSGLQHAAPRLSGTPLTRMHPGVRPCSPRQPTVASKGQKFAAVAGDQATVASRRAALLALVSTVVFVSVPAVARPPGVLAAPAASAGAATSNTLKTLSVSERKNILAALQDTVPPSKAPLMLRLVFHDGATYRVASKDGGVNGSIQYELDRPESFGLKRASFISLF